MSQNDQPQTSRRGAPDLHVATAAEAGTASSVTDGAGDAPSELRAGSTARAVRSASGRVYPARTPDRGPVDHSPSAAAERKASRVARRAEEQRASIEADPLEAARALCLAELQRGPRTHVELAGVLARAGVPAEAASEVLDRFAEVGVIDDALFAQMWVDSRQVRRGLSRGALRQELRRKGVQDDVVTQALAGIQTTDEEQLARGLLERKLASTRGLDPQARTRRLVGLLARKGFDASLSYRVVREALDQEGGDPDLAPSSET